MFHIFVDNLRWIDGSEDYTDDLCLHGQAVARIGGETFSYDATVSATGLYLLKSLRKDHIKGRNIQMLPCCGHFMIPDEALEEVEIIGCDCGIDWTVRHQGEMIELVTESGKRTFVPLAIYREEVFRFADRIEDFYRKCSEKTFADRDSREGYLAFWREWHRRRGFRRIET